MSDTSHVANRPNRSAEPVQHHDTIAPPVLISGVLRVRLPKSASVKPRRIEVKQG